jgi:hypothetical protein
LSLPLPDFDFPAALEPSSPDNGGGTPGSTASDVSEVVVVDFTNVELVANTRVVDVVLLVTLTVVVVGRAVVDVVDDEDDELAVLVDDAVTTTTPVIPWL